MNETTPTAIDDAMTPIVSAARGGTRVYGAGATEVR